MLDGTALIVSTVLGLAAFFIRAAVGGVRGENRTALLRGPEPEPRAGLVVALIEKVNVSQALEDYCYYNNPWEAWGYLVGAGPRAGRGPLIWSDALVFGVAIPYFLVFLGVTAIVVRGVWF